MLGVESTTDCGATGLHPTDAVKGVNETSTLRADPACTDELAVLRAPLVRQVPSEGQHADEVKLQTILSCGGQVVARDCPGVLEITSDELQRDAGDVPVDFDAL